MVRSNSTCGMHDDIESMDPRQRKRIQNRAAQKTYREKLKRRIEDLEKWRAVAMALASSKNHEAGGSDILQGNDTLDNSSWTSPKQLPPLQSPVSPSPPSPPQILCPPPEAQPSSLSDKLMQPDVETLLSFGWNTGPSESLGMFHDFGLPDLEDIPTRTPPPTEQEGPSPRETASTTRRYEPNAELVDHTPEDGSHGALLSPRTACSKKSSSSRTSESTSPSRQSIGSDSEGKTAFHLAAERNQQKMIRMLLPLVSDPDCRDAKGRTALHLAVENNHVSVVRILAGCDGHTKAGSYANVNAQDLDGLTPLHYSVMHGFESMVECLLGITGVDIERKDYAGNTPLHQALLCGFDGVAEALIRKGADFNARVG